MANICKTVNLYTRKIKKGTMLSFFLDYYPGYRDAATNKVLRHESLGIYIYAHPKNQREKDYNARLTEKAEAMRCRRYEEVVNERYDFFDSRKLSGSFIDYFKEHARKKNARYVQTFIHFNRFTGGKCTFAEINIELCNKFLEYLHTTTQVIHTKRKLHPNSITSYWSAFLGTLHAAHRDRKIKDNPCPYLERAESIPTDRVGLSADELITLAETPCDVPILKRAFLFACLTGLRKSDVKALTWEMIQPEADGTPYVTI
ncbi:MAG: site-specific integrase, partial [Prevotella sp.]|nr:site-specific integrase [Prevotella sp.]